MSSETDIGEGPTPEAPPELRACLLQMPFPANDVAVLKIEAFKRGIESVHIEHEISPWYE